jgi:hypothetical protein
VQEPEWLSVLHISRPLLGLHFSTSLSLAYLRAGPKESMYFPMPYGLLPSFSFIFYILSCRVSLSPCAWISVATRGEASIHGHAYRVCKNRLERKTVFGSPLVISVERTVHYAKNMMSSYLRLFQCVGCHQPKSFET